MSLPEVGACWNWVWWSWYVFFPYALFALSATFLRKPFLNRTRVWKGLLISAAVAILLNQLILYYTGLPVLLGDFPGGFLLANSFFFPYAYPAWYIAYVVTAISPWPAKRHTKWWYTYRVVILLLVFNALLYLVMLPLAVGFYLILNHIAISAM